MGLDRKRVPEEHACRCPLLTRPGNKIVLVRAAANLLTLEVACRVRTPWFNTTHAMSRGPHKSDLKSTN